MDSVLLTVSSSLVQSSVLAFSASRRPSKENLFRYSRCRWSPCSVPLRYPNWVFGFRNGKHSSGPNIPLRVSCFNGAEKEPQSSPTEEELGLDWPILQRWDVPWKWQTVTLTIFGCGISIVTAVVLGVIFGITNSFKPYPDDIFRYKFKDPFNHQNGWLLWAGIGFVGAILAIALTGAALALFNSENPQRETDALVRLSPLIGSSTISTACLVGITGVLAPLLEETLFRGFLMVSLTKWFPTPVSALLAAAVFAVAHLTPGEFPQLFVLGAVLGISYAQTRNLLTPITIHALWNSGVILLLTFLQLQGYDIRELLQGQ